MVEGKKLVHCQQKKLCWWGKEVADRDGKSGYWFSSSGKKRKRFDIKRTIWSRWSVQIRESCLREEVFSINWQNKELGQDQR